MIEQLTRQAIKQEQDRLAENRRPRPCIEDVTNVEGHSVDGAEHEGREARLMNTGELLKDGATQVSTDEQPAMLGSTLMSAGGEECVLGQVTGPVATVGESNAPPPLPPAEEEGGGGLTRAARSRSPLGRCIVRISNRRRRVFGGRCSCGRR
jgi:hypothetical protein